jgi:hypothetical protein
MTPRTVTGHKGRANILYVCFRPLRAQTDEISNYDASAPAPAGKFPGQKDAARRLPIPRSA